MLPKFTLIFLITNFILFFGDKGTDGYLTNTTMNGLESLVSLNNSTEVSR